MRTPALPLAAVVVALPDCAPPCGVHGPDWRGRYPVVGALPRRRAAALRVLPGWVRRVGQGERRPANGPLKPLSPAPHAAPAARMCAS